MPSTRRCVFGCNTTGVTVHNFPNPRTFQEQFRIWVGLAGASVSGMTDMQIYKYRKVCDKHFAEQDRNRNSRLNALAIPHLHIPMPLLPVASEANFNMQSDFQSTSVQITGATTPSIQKEFYVCDNPVPTTSKASFASHSRTTFPSVRVEFYKNTRKQIKNLRSEICRQRKGAKNFKERLQNAEKLSKKTVLQTITNKMSLPAKI